MEINGVKSQNSLYLKVSVDQVPENIDAAILYFRDALKELLIQHIGAKPRIKDDSFYSSNFMSSYNDDSCIVKQWNSINKGILGLWCWDITKNEKYSIEKAAEIIKNKLPPNYFQYDATTIEAYYAEFARSLSLESKKKKIL